MTYRLSRPQVSLFLPLFMIDVNITLDLSARTNGAFTRISVSDKLSGMDALSTAVP